MEMFVRIASLVDFEAIQHLDQKIVTSGLDRSVRITQAIHENSCYTLISNSYLQGFALFKLKAFREMDFLDLLIVDPAFRRQGVGSALIGHFRENATTDFCWTSTNASNDPMISLLKRSGWIESGHMEDSDPGDPDIFFYTQKAG